MIADTLDRVRPLASPGEVWILTARDLLGAVRDALPEVPAGRVVGEPVGKNTAPAIALASWWIRGSGPGTVAVVLPSDHRVAPPDRFCDEVRAAAKVALDRGAVVTFGVPPSRPETGYGYIESGPAVAPGSPFHTVKAFREKPDPSTAERFASDGRHLWNAGIFVFPPEVMLAEIGAHAPEIAALVDALPAEPGPGADAALERFYSAVPSISIDYAVMERSTRAFVARAGFAWDDVGSWAALGAIPDGGGEEGNVSRGRALLKDCRGVIAFGEGGLIAALGVSNLVIVKAGDVTFVCPRDRAQDVRSIVARLDAEDDLRGFR